MLSWVTTPSRRVGAILLAAIVAATGMLVASQASLVGARAAREPVTIQFLNVSDWHGQIDPLDVFGLGLVGGASTIASYWNADRAEFPDTTIALTAGDDFGATPPLSNFFEERPAILAQRMMGIRFGTFGNHNFDRGVEHLQQMIDLARTPSANVPGEPFQYVSANLANTKGTLKHVRPYDIIKIGGVKVAFIGITNPEAPELVFPGAFGPIVITDPVEAANRARADARRAGADVVVAMIHAGIRGVDSGTGAPFGELIDFANGVTGFDVIFGDHTDFQVGDDSNPLFINGALVQENRSKGRTYSRTFVTVQADTGEVLDASIQYVTPFANAVTPDPAIEAMLQPFREELGTVLGVVVGESTVEIPHADKCGTANGRTCESLVGNTVTDAMRLTYGTDFAITNAGGLRAPLTCPAAGSDVCPAFTPPPYPISLGQVLTVLPFGNQSATLAVNGAELKAMLENGVSLAGAQGRFPQVSGLCFTYDINAAAGSRVVSAVRQAEDGSCTGAAIDLTAGSSYSLTTNDFVASGGDGYPNFSARMVTRNIMANDVADWLTTEESISPAIQDRIVCTSSGAATCPVVVSP
jgi:2',3'-cyclic-nucleotide 2'-phosphodiesterase (5'-nucleotidase family)